MSEVLQLRHVPRLLLRRERWEVQESQDESPDAGVLHQRKSISPPAASPPSFVLESGGLNLLKYLIKSTQRREHSTEHCFRLRQGRT